MSSHVRSSQVYPPYGCRLTLWAACSRPTSVGSSGVSRTYQVHRSMQEHRGRQTCPQLPHDILTRPDRNYGPLRRDCEACWKVPKSGLIGLLTPLTASPGRTSAQSRMHWGARRIPILLGMCMTCIKCLSQMIIVDRLPILACGTTVTTHACTRTPSVGKATLRRDRLRSIRVTSGGQTSFSQPKGLHTWGCPLRWTCPASLCRCPTARSQATHTLRSISPTPAVPMLSKMRMSMLRSRSRSVRISCPKTSSKVSTIRSSITGDITNTREILGTVTSLGVSERCVALS